MTREYAELISHKALIDLTLITHEQNDLLREAIKEISERDCDNCKHYRTGDAKVYPELCLGCKWFHTDNFIEMEEEDD